MDVQDRRPALDVRAVEDDLAVEAARPQQRRVEHVRAVGGGDHDHVGVRVEAVHLDQDLVERLLALVVRAAEAGAALAADRVDLVHEHDARRVALGLVEQVAHADWRRRRRTSPRTPSRRCEKNGTPASPATARESSVLPVPGGPTSSTPRGMRAPSAANFSGYLRNSTTSVSSCLASSTPGHVLERDGRLVAHEHPGAALAEAQRLVVRALRLAHHEEDEPADEKDGQERGDQQREDAACGALLDRGEVLAVEVAGVPGYASQIGVDVRQLRRDDGGLLTAVHGRRHPQPVLGDFGGLARLGIGDELAVGVFRGLAAVAHEGPEDRQSEDSEDHEHNAVAHDAAGQFRSTFASVWSVAGLRPSPARDLKAPSPASIGWAARGNKHPESATAVMVNTFPAPVSGHSPSCSVMERLRTDALRPPPSSIVTPPRDPPAASSSASRRSALGGGSPIASRRTRRPRAAGGGSRQSMVPSSPQRRASSAAATPVEQGVVGRRQAGESADAVDRAGAKGLQQRQHLATHAIAQEGRILVRGVLEVRHARGVEVVAERRAPLAEERPNDAPSPRRHAGDPRRAGSAQQVEKHRLGQVVQGVGSGDQRIGQRDILQKPIARLAAGVLERPPFRTREPGDIGAPELHGEIERARRIGDERGVVRASGPQAVIEMRDRQAPATAARGDQVGGAGEEGHRVGPARHGQDERRVVGDVEAARAAVHGRGEVVEALGSSAPAHGTAAIRCDPSVRGGSGGRIRTTGQGLMSPLLYH